MKCTTCLGDRMPCVLNNIIFSLLKYYMLRTTNTRPCPVTCLRKPARVFGILQGENTWRVPRSHPTSFFPVDDDHHSLACMNNPPPPDCEWPRACIHYVSTTRLTMSNTHSHESLATGAFLIIVDILSILSFNSAEIDEETAFTAQ